MLGEKEQCNKCLLQYKLGLDKRTMRRKEHSSSVDKFLLQISCCSRGKKLSVVTTVVFSCFFYKKGLGVLLKYFRHYFSNT